MALDVLVKKSCELPVCTTCATYSTALDITDAAYALAGESCPVDTDDLAVISPYVTRTIRRFSSWVVDLTPPAQAPATRWDLDTRPVPRGLSRTPAQVMLIRESAPASR